MFNTFVISFKLKNTYRTNGIIYSLRQLPIIKKILPNNLEKNGGLKTLANIISAILEIGSIFLGKIFYILLMVITPLTLYKSNNPNIILHILVFLTIIGAFLNTTIFNPSKDKYYAMFNLRMNPKKYTLTDYFYFLVKILIGFLPLVIFIAISYKINIFICLIIPFFIIGTKMIISTYSLYKFNKQGVIPNENNVDKFVWIIVGICLFLAYGLPYLNIVINQSIFLVIDFISVILGVLAFKYIINYNNYQPIYKILLTSQAIDVKVQTKDLIKNNNMRLIDNTTTYNSNKKGFEYFNDLFIKRHKKILLKSAKKTALIVLIIIIGVIGVSLFSYEFKENLNKSLLIELPYFVFIMYMINRTQTICQTMFMNCDHSLLTYSFYKDPKAILKLFKLRLLSVIKINLIPTSVIALGLPLILFITGGTDNIMNYFLLFISIISLGVFFSIHHLVVYYMLQPYNINLEIKSSTYSFANFITYLVCYTMLKFEMSTLIFGIVLVIFSILYSLISLLIVYKFAHKTFKLRT